MYATNAANSALFRYPHRSPKPSPLSNAVSEDALEAAFTLGAVAALRNVAARYTRRAQDGTCSSETSPGVAIQTSEAAMAAPQAVQLTSLADEIELAVIAS